MKKTAKKVKQTTILPIERLPQGPLSPPLLGTKHKLPRLRDRQAFVLSQEGKTQAEIAKIQGCCQSTVSRGIERVEVWRAKTLPDQRREVTALEQFYIAVDRQQAHLARLTRRALEDYEESKQPVPMKKTVTTTYKTKDEVEKVVIRVEEWQKPQGAKASLLAAAERFGTAATLLAGGCVGSGRGSVMMAEAIDPDELGRWHHVVKARDQQIAQQAEQMKHLERQLAEAKKAAVTSEISALQSDAKDAKMHHKDADEYVATYCENEACGEEANPEPAHENSAENVHNLESREPVGCVETRNEALTHRDVAGHAMERPVRCVGSSQGSPGHTLPPSATLPPATSEHPVEPPKQYRWNEAYRQEALDYYCQIHNLPRAKVSQVSGLPDPVRCTPKQALERGYPCLVHIDRAEEDKERFQTHLRREEARRRRDGF